MNSFARPRLAFMLAMGGVVTLGVAGFFLFGNRESRAPENSLRAQEQREEKKNPEKIMLNWQQVPAESIPWRKRDSHAVYEWGNKLWFSGGLDADLSKVNGIPNYEQAKYYNDIWASLDGKRWELVTEHAEFPPIRSASVIAWRGVLYMMGGWSPKVGYQNGIWKSSDGAHWIQTPQIPPWEEREGQKVIEFQGKLWLIGGVNYFRRKTFNDVWSSDDALHWTLVASSTPWHTRWDHDIAVFENKLWLMGGMNFGSTGYSDVWSSEDGAHWHLETAEAPWGKRQGHGVVVFRHLLWLVGGLDAETAEGRGDAWSTKNGKDWEKNQNDGAWLGREDHGVIVFDDAIWVIGGMDSNLHWNNDVWYARPSQE